MSRRRLPPQQQEIVRAIRANRAQRQRERRQQALQRQQQRQGRRARAIATTHPARVVVTAAPAAPMAPTAPPPQPRREGKREVNGPPSPEDLAAAFATLTTDGPRWPTASSSTAPNPDPAYQRPSSSWESGFTHHPSAVSSSQGLDHKVTQYLDLKHQPVPTPQATLQKEEDTTFLMQARPTPQSPYFIQCPHCHMGIEVEWNQVNCKIFRHGVLKATGQPMNPHTPKNECDRLAREGLIWGCGRPFRFDGLSPPRIEKYI